MNSELQNCQQTEPCTVEEIRNSLEQSEKGKVYNTAANYKRVLQYDPLLKGAIRKNLLTERIDIVKPLGWYRDSPTLTDVDVKYLLLYFEENYGLTVEKKIIDAVAVIANENRYHPVCDFLNALQWDGTERITYLLISGKKAHSSLEIAQALWPDDSTNPAKNMRNLIYRLRQTFGLISEKELIVSTASGYQFNPDLHIMTDYQQFDDLIQLASKASSVINRVELLKNAIDLYCGKILSSADGEHWLIQFAAKYHIAYVGAVNELLKQLNALHSYDLLNQYAARSLAIVPENSRGYYWLIHSLKVQGMDELASNEYQLAKQHLTTEEYKELCTSLGDSCE